MRYHHTNPEIATIAKTDGVDKDVENRKCHILRVSKQKGIVTWQFLLKLSMQESDGRRRENACKDIWHRTVSCDLGHKHLMSV